MVTDTVLVARLREIIRASDLQTTTAGTVRRQLEREFDVDLSDRKKFVTEQIDEFLDEERDVIDDGGEAANGEVIEEGESGGDGGDDGEDEEEENDDQRSNDEETTKKKRGGGFTKLCSLSPQLQEFVGVSEMARTEVVKKLWAYIRENDLQDPKNKRNIKCDQKLNSLFRVNTINMFQMNKVLSKHIWPLEAEEEPSINSKPLAKKPKRQKEEDASDSKQKAKQQKTGTSGFLKPLQLSEAFVNFLGTGETALSRADAVKRMWDYIKQNDLQDPSDKRRILCDEKLKDLFEVDSFHGFSVSKFLTAHLTKM